MRENMGLYRGKRLDNGEWAEGCLLYDREQNEAFIAESFEDRAANIREVDPATVGEFTGSHDKNGKKIFEDDVVICSMIGANYTPPCYWNRKQVVFERGTFCLEDLGGDTVPLWSYATGVEIEVIGNIHDHPKLQEVKK